MVIVARAEVYVAPLASEILAASSKRAMSSMITVTSLPARAAATRWSMIGLFAPVRYSVILIASTLGSRAAALMKSMTGEKE